MLFRKDYYHSVCVHDLYLQVEVLELVLVVLVVDAVVAEN